MSKGIYNSTEASLLTIENFAKKLSALDSYESCVKELRLALTTNSIPATFTALTQIAEIAGKRSTELSQRIRRVALALSYAEENEEDFATREDMDWIPRVKDGLTSYNLISMEYQITDDATSFQEGWIFPGKRIFVNDLGHLLIGVDYSLEPRTAKPIPEGSVALSVFFEKIVPDSRGTASKHILPLYLIIVPNTRFHVKLGLLRLRLRVGFTNLEQKLTARFEDIKAKKA